MPSGESMYTLSNPPAANSQSTSSYPMPLTVRLIASTNGASIGNTLRTPKMKNGPSSPLFEEAGFEGALGPAASGSLDCRAAPGRSNSLPGPAAVDLHRPAMTLNSTNRPPRPKMHPVSRADYLGRNTKVPTWPPDAAPEVAHLPRCIPETAQKPGDFSSARL